MCACSQFVSTVADGEEASCPLPYASMRPADPVRTERTDKAMHIQDAPLNESDGPGVSIHPSATSCSLVGALPRNALSRGVRPGGAFAFVDLRQGQLCAAWARSPPANRQTKEEYGARYFTDGRSPANP